MCQEASAMLGEIAGPYRYRPDQDAPATGQLGNSVREANMRRAMERFAIEVLVREAVSASEQFASAFTLPRYGLGGWGLMECRAIPANNSDPASLNMIFTFRLGPPSGNNRDNTRRFRVAATRFAQERLQVDVGMTGPGNSNRLVSVMAGIFPDAGGVTISADSLLPAGRPRAPRAPSRPTPARSGGRR